MNTFKYECPRCGEITAGDESIYGQQVKCPKCQAAILIPQVPATSPLPVARLVPESGAVAPGAGEAAGEETEVFNLSPVLCAFVGQLMVGALFVSLGLFVEVGFPGQAWSRWVAIVLFALCLLMLLLVWIRMKTHSFRLTNQRLFVSRGWIAKSVDEVELYRVEDVRVDQGILQRLLGYGTITVLANDNTTPQLALFGIAKPMEVKETIRTQYRAARKREGVHPTEFIQSPNQAPAPDSHPK